MTPVNIETIEAPKTPTTQEINAAIEGRRTGLMDAISADRKQRDVLSARIKENLAAIAELPRPPIKRAKKAAK